MNYNADETFVMEITKSIARFGKIKSIICEGYMCEPKEQYITFTDDKDRTVCFPLKPNYPDDESDIFNENGYLVLLNLMIQKVLHQIGEDANAYWLLDINQIDTVLTVLKEKVPFKVVECNDLYANLD